ncbi:nucleoside diphosphate kinase regulator [Shinella daejeonensis]|uniref:nucleoside diphosphate kinase regulator n=1 Tax=Shinella daejeonensis TaxID=659017 RepID=UPI0020C7CE24|nr:nucleoside diphosphate kinase regulator [Shinella daejeonensis]MCP8896286.1 nucleoside diphosphate kinase regulator [Shinella daejeonensis]
MTNSAPSARPRAGQAKPRIVISEEDHARLMRLADSLYDNAPDLAEALIGELERATVRPGAKVPKDTAQMGSAVEYATGDGQTRRVILVYPGEAEISAGKVSILTPIGTALIGLSPGQSIAWTARDGREHRLTVNAVEQDAAS